MRTLLMISLVALGIASFGQDALADRDRGHGRGHGHGHYKHHGYKHHHDYRPRSTITFYYNTAPRVLYYPVYVPQYTQPIVLGQQVAINTGDFCREYQSTVMVGGMRQSSYGTACLQPDNSWRIVN